MTKQEKEELCKLCGFVQRGGAYTGQALWIAPDEVKEFDEACSVTEKSGYARMPHKDTYYRLPPITLDNYWKYVIPTLQKKYPHWRYLLHDWINDLVGSHEKDTVLLFAQTYGIIKEKGRE